MSGGDDLLRDRDVRTGRIEASRDIQEGMRLRQADPGVRVDDRRDDHPVGPGLRHHGIRLDAIENLLPLLGGLLGLIGGGRVGQRLVRGLKFLLKVLVFLFQGDQLDPGIFVFPERRDCVSDFFCVDLGDEIDCHDDGIAVNGRIGLLIEDEDEAGGIGPDFIFGDVHAVDDRDAFEIGRDLFERVAFGGFRRHANGIFAGVAVPHPVLALSRDDSDFGFRKRCHWEQGKAQEK